MSDEQELARTNAVFGGNVRARRENLGWSQSELARKMADAGWSKYSQMTVARTEDSSRAARLDEARALAVVLGMDLTDLLEPSGAASAAAGLRDALRALGAAGHQVAEAVSDYDFARAVLRRELAEVEPHTRSGDLGRREARALEQLVAEARGALGRTYQDAINAWMDDVHGEREGEAE